MQNRNFILILAAMPLVLGACATLSGHGHTRGTVVLSDDQKEAHVCIAKTGVKVGDIVQVYDANCKQVEIRMVRGAKYQTKCEKIYRGQAEVLEITDEDHAKIKAIGELNLNANQIIEK